MPYMGDGTTDDSKLIGSKHASNLTFSWSCWVFKL
jgi:hypothetical protein